jgi:DNA-binding NtrC family response regulator
LVAIRTDVLFLDDDEDLRAVFYDLTAQFGKSCLIARSHSELVDLGERALACDVAILDINLGPNAPSGMDSYRWLKQRGFRGKVVFLTGHAESHPLVREARQLGGAEVFEKPIGFDRLCEIWGA